MNRQWKDQNGNRQEDVTFIDVTLWGRTAEIACEYLRKGRPAMIEGRLQLDQWDDRETGAKRSKLKVVGETLQLLGSRQDSAGGGGQSAGRSSAAKPSADQEYFGGAPEPAGSAVGGGGGSAADEDVPF